MYHEVCLVDNDDNEDDNDDSQAEARSTTTAPTPTTSTTTTTRRPTTTTTTSKPYSTSTYRSAPSRSQQPPKKPSSLPVSSTFKPKSPHYLTTARPYEEEEEDRDEELQHNNHKPAPSSSATGEDTDYAYEDTDYPVTDGKDLESYQDGGEFIEYTFESPLIMYIIPLKGLYGNDNDNGGLAEHVFSPQQFIFNQNSNNNKGSLGSSQSKPAISFQQQQFQNGGSLTVTNSHVTVTTHTDPKKAQDKNKNNNHSNHKQFSSRPKESALVTAGPSTAEEDEETIRGGYSTTRKPHYSYGPPQQTPTTPKRLSPTPTASSSQQTANAGHPGLPNLPNFQITAHGFRLPTAQTDLIQAAQEKHAMELQTHRQQILDQLKQQQDLSPQEQHLREQEKHQQLLEKFQQAEIAKQLREQEEIRKEQELQRREQERKNQQREQQQQQEQDHQLQLQSSSNSFEGYRRHTPQVYTLPNNGLFFIFVNYLSYPQRYRCVYHSSTTLINHNSWHWPVQTLTSRSSSIRTRNDRILMPIMQAPRNPPQYLLQSTLRMSIERPYRAALAVDVPSQTITMPAITQNPKRRIRKPS